MTVAAATWIGRGDADHEIPRLLVRDSAKITMMSALRHSPVPRNAIARLAACLEGLPLSSYSTPCTATMRKSAAPSRSFLTFW